jgi:signal transduction histidine kinase
MRRVRWSMQWSTLLPMIFALIAMSFVAVTAFTQSRMADVDRAALDIADNAAPSIERLAEARSVMREMQLRLREAVDRGSVGGPELVTIESARARMDRALDDYLRLPVFPGESERWSEILRQKDLLNAAVAKCVVALSRGDPAAAQRILRDEIAKTADDLGSAFTRAIELNAEQSRDLARHIRARRVSTARSAFGLDVVCALITLVGAVALSQAMRAHAALGERHRRVVEERAAELEEFAGRIAHDVLGPLGVVSLALEPRGTSANDAYARRIERGRRAIDRVRVLVDGLLGFARAGARPEPGARADVDATIEDLVPDLQTAAAEAGVELHVSANAQCSAACSPGVLTSLIANLARNAIKYIGDGALRYVEIRAYEDDDHVRVEVIDTGPGLTPGFEERAFDPYVRGRSSSKPGIGLGLATVKRMIDGHRGRVGVRSVPGRGCTFWFELPIAAEESTFNVLSRVPARAVQERPG